MRVSLIHKAESRVLKWCHLHTGNVARGVQTTTTGTSHTNRAQLLGIYLHGINYINTLHILPTSEQGDFISVWSWSHLYMLHGLLPTGAPVTLHLNTVNIQDGNLVSQHQKHGIIKVVGTINVPPLHDCRMMHFIDLVTYHFPLQMLYLYWVPTQASRISLVIWYLFPSSPWVGGFNQTFQSVQFTTLWFTSTSALPWHPHINSCFPLIHLVGIKTLISTVLDEMRQNK